MVISYQESEAASGGMLFEFEPSAATSADNLCAPAPQLEEFDWTSKKTGHLFADLEQKELAGKSSEEESRRYKLMRQHRNKLVFADRYFDDYAEMQRIRTLTEKLRELQKYVRPIKVN